jgi:tetratricopeptide (TPR) repeat protein
MAERLLERESQLDVLVDSVADAAAGHGSTVLVTGDAGIGKTTLVRAFADRVDDRARLMLTASDDLTTPRTLGPLRDAAAGTQGPLATALADDRTADGVFPALMEELAQRRPTVLVVEDVHWADDATVDVLGYAARRVEPVGAVLVLTLRDEEVGPSHPLHRLLGALAGYTVHRLALAPLSRRAVRTLAAGTGRDGATLHELTRGNPFYVTEALAAPPDEVPASVSDAVLARLRRLDPEARDALERLSVVPSHVGAGLATKLLGPDVDALVAAELAGMIELRPEGLAFRHEIARRAVEQSLPELRRRSLNQDVVDALRAEDRPERARLMHHAAQAGDVETVLAVGPGAAREAARAGSHRQALAHFESVVPHTATLPARERAAILDDYGWELYNAHRFREAVDASDQAARTYERLGDRVALGLCLVRASRHLFMAGETDAAEDSAGRAVLILEDAGDDAALAHATLYRGAILALTDPSGEAVAVLERARRLARRSQRADLAALCLNYLGIARFESGDPAGLDNVRDSVAVATAGGHHEEAARGYTNLAELLLRTGRLDELERCVHDGLAFTRERGFWSHAYNLEVHRCLLLLRRGQWDAAEQGLRRLVEDVDDPGCSSPTASRGSGACSPAGATRPPARCSTARGDRRSATACCSGWHMRGSLASSGRGWPASRTSRPPSPTCCCRAPSIPAPRRFAVSCCATSRAPGSRRSRSPAALSATPPGCAATGALPPPRGATSATPTRRRSSSSSRARRSRRSRDCARWPGSARRRPPRTRAIACA